jgi:5-formyltetrahydrofolate cyclo-ligase
MKMSIRGLTGNIKDKSKAELRRALRDHRDRMRPEEVAERSNRVCRRLLSLPEFIEAHNTLFYMSYRNELDTHGMIQRSIEIGKRVNIPRMQLDGLSLEVCQIRDLDSDTAPGMFGIIEPTESAEKCADTSRIDLCVIPGIAFDRRGHRIGWGKGFYDRFLATLSEHTKKFGLAYDFQLLEKINSHDRDIPLDGLITESEVLRFEHNHDFTKSP